MSLLEQYTINKDRIDEATFQVEFNDGNNNGSFHPFVGKSPSPVIRGLASYQTHLLFRLARLPSLLVYCVCPTLLDPIVITTESIKIGRSFLPSLI